MKNFLCLILTSCVFIFTLPLHSQQWTYVEDFKQGLMPHGITIDPEGKIWIGYYGVTDTLGMPADTIPIRPIYVYYPDGSEAPFSPIRFVTVNSVTDTMKEGCRGISLDHEGNILYSHGNTLYKINYSTGEGIAKWVNPDESIIGKVACDSVGNIFVVNIVGGDIKILDSGLNFVTNAISEFYSYQRGLLVSDDGRDLFIGRIGPVYGVLHFYNANGPGTEYSLIDSFQTDLIAQCLDWDRNGLMWLGTWWSAPDSLPQGWYALDPTLNWAIVDSVGLPGPGTPDGSVPQGSSIYSPRGSAWSSDGKTMYTVDFDGHVIKKWYNAQPVQPADSLSTEFIIYVDVNNKSGIEDGSQANPFSSISNAVTAASSGYQLFVASGTYDENPVISGITLYLYGGYESANWTRGIDEYETVIDGGLRYTTISLNGGNSVIDGFSIINGQAPEWGGGGGIEAWDGDYIIRTCKIYNNSGLAIEAWGAGGAVFANGNIQILNCEIYANHSSGGASAIRGGGCHIYVRNSLIVSNTGYEVFHLDGSSGEFVNCTIANNEKKQLGSNPELIIFSNCIIWNNGNGSWNGWATISYSNVEEIISGQGNISTLPFFFDPINSDYRLQINSPCIDAGDPDTVYNDMDGTRNDMGKYGGPGGISYTYEDAVPVILRTPDILDHIPPGEALTIHATIHDPGTIMSIQAEIESPDENVLYTVELFDDGSHNDGASGDSIYANTWINPGIEGMHYFIDIFATHNNLKRSVYNNIAEVDILKSYPHGLSKTITSGYVRSRVVDSGDEGEGSWGWGSSSTFYNGFTQSEGIFSSKAMFLGCKNFTDKDNILHPIKVSGHGQWETDNMRVMIPVCDENNYTIHKYLRYQPPKVSVNRMSIKEPFPQDGSDHINPDKIGGTADEMIESWINTDMGITIHQKVYAYSQKNHDQYQIYEWTFINTGNINQDDEIELNQTLEDVYYLRQIRPYENPKVWMSSYGEMSEDTLRLIYGYPQRESNSPLDNFGDPENLTGFLKKPWYVGESVLFASQNINDVHSDNPNQPFMTAVRDCDLPFLVLHSGNLDENQINTLYKVMKEGFLTYPSNPDPEIPNSRPGHHSVRFDQRGYKYASDVPWWGNTLAGIYAFGPYTMSQGDSFRVVWAQVIGIISPEKAFEVGKAWKSGTAELTWSGSIDDLSEYYPAFVSHPDLSPTDNDKAKDRWVCTGKDSLFKNAAAALWAYKNNYHVPQAPPPPSVDIISQSDKIGISWGNESESAIDFAGYRVYRAEGDWYTHIPNGEMNLVGVWELIFECGLGTANPEIIHTYDDFNIQPGIEYFYYITAFDDGMHNAPDFHGKVEILESSKFANMTTIGAVLGRLGYAGDYTGDNLINYDDLTEFTLAWRNQDLTREIGPATGTPPLLIPQPDGVIDFEDLMVLVLQWNWSYDHPDGLFKPLHLDNLKQLYTSGEPLRFEYPLQTQLPKRSDITEGLNSHLLRIEQSYYDPWTENFGDELVIALDTVCQVLGMELYSEFSDKNAFIDEYEETLLKGKQGVTLCGKNEQNGAILFNAVVLENHSEKQSNELMRLHIDYADERSVPVQFSWRIHDTSGVLICSGSRQMVLQGHSITPSQYALYQNFPNPFNATTVIRYQLPVAGKVRLEIFNILGQKVITLVDQKQMAGFYEHFWDTSISENIISSGLFILHLKIEGKDGSNYINNRKLLLIK